MHSDEIEVGQAVRYHPIIGGDHDGKVYTVRDKGEVCGTPVVWLHGKAGCIDAEAISPTACQPAPAAGSFGV